MSEPLIKWYISGIINEVKQSVWRHFNRRMTVGLALFRTMIWVLFLSDDLWHKSGVHPLMRAQRLKALGASVKICEQFLQLKEHLQLYLTTFPHSYLLNVSCYTSSFTRVFLISPARSNSCHAFGRGSCQKNVTFEYKYLSYKDTKVLKQLRLFSQSLYSRTFPLDVDIWKTEITTPRV